MPARGKAFPLTGRLSPSASEVGVRLPRERERARRRSRRRAAWLLSRPPPLVPVVAALIMLLHSVSESRPWTISRTNWHPLTTPQSRISKITSSASSKQLVKALRVYMAAFEDFFLHSLREARDLVVDRDRLVARVSPLSSWFAQHAMSDRTQVDERLGSNRLVTLRVVYWSAATASARTSRRLNFARVDELTVPHDFAIFHFPNVGVVNLHMLTGHSVCPFKLSY